MASSICLISILGGACLFSILGGAILVISQHSRTAHIDPAHSLLDGSPCNLDKPVGQSNILQNAGPFSGAILVISDIWYAGVLIISQHSRTAHIDPAHSLLDGSPC